VKYTVVFLPPNPLGRRFSTGQGKDYRFPDRQIAYRERNNSRISKNHRSKLALKLPPR
jgi:hypothetical protein